MKVRSKILLIVAVLYFWPYISPCFNESISTLSNATRSWISNWMHGAPLLSDPPIVENPPLFAPLGGHARIVPAERPLSDEAPAEPKWY